MIKLVRGSGLLNKWVIAGRYPSGLCYIDIHLPFGYGLLTIGLMV